MRKLHPASAVFRALGMGVSIGSFGLFAGFGLVAFLESDLGFIAAIGVAVLAFAAGAALGVAQYYRFSYDVSGGTLSIRSGVFDRQERDIPLGRIQNVDIRRNLVNRILGLAVVQFETAGGADTEGVINAVSYEEARRLQDAVARGQRDEQAEAEDAAEGAAEDATDAPGSGSAPTGRPTEGLEGAATVDGEPGERWVDGEPGERRVDGEPGERRVDRDATTERADAEEELVHMGSGDLFVLSLASVRPSAPLLVIFGLPIFSDIAVRVFLQTILALGGPEVDSLEGVATLPPLETLFFVVVGGIQLALVTWVASALITANAYYDFRLTRVGNDLRYERGFLQRYSGTIPLDKVQTVTVRENLLMRRFGYGALALETAGYGPGQSDGDATNTAVPLDKLAVVIDLAEELGDVSVPEIERPPRRARRRYAVRFGLVVLAIAAGLWAVSTYLWTFPWWVALGGFVLAPIAGHYRWKHRGYALTEPAFVARQGFWQRRTRFVPYYRIQTAIDQRTVFQRWRNLASVTADTASSASIVGGDATAHDIEEDDAQSLHPTLLERLQDDLFSRGEGGEESGETGTPAD